MTYLDLIRRAMRSIGVLHHAENPTDSEAQDALDTLNDMLEAWRIEGVDLEYLTASLTDTVPYPNDHIAAMRYNLAAELAGEYGAEIPPVVAVRASELFKMLRSQLMKVDTLSVDDALNPIYNPNLEAGFYEEI